MYRKREPPQSPLLLQQRLLPLPLRQNLRQLWLLLLPQPCSGGARCPSPRPCGSPRCRPSRTPCPCPVPVAAAPPPPRHQLHPLPSRRLLPPRSADGPCSSTTSSCPTPRPPLLPRIRSTRPPQPLQLSRRSTQPRHLPSHSTLRPHPAPLSSPATSAAVLAAAADSPSRPATGSSPSARQRRLPGRIQPTTHGAGTGLPHQSLNATGGPCLKSVHCHDPACRRKAIRPVPLLSCVPRARTGPGKQADCGTQAGRQAGRQRIVETPGGCTV